jgi:hypothetical protein
MTNSIKGTLRGIAAASVLAGALGAQERTQERPQVPPLPQAGGESARQEMIELFHKVERRLNEIDELLYKAGSGESGLESQSESGIAELLQRSQEGGKEVLGGIDRILEIARQQGGT